MAAAADNTRHLALATLVGGVIVGLVARLVFAFQDDGLLWPDEYYQSLEPAHRLVFGYGWQAWEFLEGARHWTLPGFVAGVMKLSSTLGLDYLKAIEVTFCLAGAATALGIYALARAQEATALSSAIVATSFALMGFAVYVAPRAMGETLSALPVVLAFATLSPSPRGGEGRGEGLRLLWAAILLTLAVGLRLQNGLFCLGALAMLFAQRRRLQAVQLLFLLTIGAAIYGAVDHLTWGAPFHSARQYLRFNLIEGRSSQFGTAPFLHYLRALVTTEGFTIVPLVALTIFGARGRAAIPLIVLAFFFVHSCIPHKELRFLFPIMPLICAQAALGLDRLGTRRNVAGAALIALSVLSLATLPTLTFWRLGISNPKGELSAIDYAGPENRLLRRASTLPDLCGLKIASIENWRTGGYAYLHQRVPMYRHQPPEHGEGHYNYAIAWRGTFTGAEVAVDGDRALIKLPTGCTPDPTYDWHLE